jgi:methylated-DNA-[protein]-cysteine S-methyltransferase
MKKHSKHSISDIGAGGKAVAESFKSKVLAVVAKIPKGRTLTYKEVAGMAGNLGAARAVGNIMSRNFDPAIPCHRVVRSDGGMGGYNRGLVRKVRILKKEGAIKNNVLVK